MTTRAAMRGEEPVPETLAGCEDAALRRTIAGASMPPVSPAASWGAPR